MNDFLDNLGAEQYEKIVKKILEKQKEKQKEEKKDD
jgi:hypothetical protein